MPNYQNGKIYKLVSLVDDYFYIGSTYCGLAQRKAKHKYTARKNLTQAVYAHFNSIGWDNCRIVLIENYPCVSKEELVRKEFEHIQANNNDKLLNVMKYIGRVCEHNRIRSVCKECGGGSICQHNREKATCKDCGGSQICEHNRQKRYCKDCLGDKYYCCECESSFCSLQKLKKHYNSKKHQNTI